MKNVLSSFPDSWKVTITVLSGGGDDKFGNPLPTTSREVTGCLLSPRATSESNNQSDYVQGEAILYAPTGTAFRSTDKIQTPEGAPIRGMWAVNGDPVNWPLGVEVQLRKDGT
ncbi:hypothetical protein ACFY5D_16680 [Paeniglutamicibacter sp. NPDC012692]|uniref:hypothetical protein n=1 Tax=Paeniglutamicibacter sp. NPDC012692 TaxID=3364388 RepID=UPI0036ACFE27